jgi:hypothetical protein
MANGVPGPPKTLLPKGLPAHQAPIAHKTVSQPLSMDATKDMKKIYEKIALKTKGHYLVGLEPERFLEKFLPWTSSTPEAYRRNSPSKQCLKNLRSMVPGQRQKEGIMYKPFVSLCFNIRLFEYT